MRHLLMCLAALIVTGAASGAYGQLLFSFEDGEPGHPYAGNPGAYVVATTTTAPPVTHGTQAITATITSGQLFGGPASSSFTDAVRAAVINGNPAVQIDMTVPDPRPGTPDFNFGNIDLQFFQTGIRPGGDADETRFSPTFALSEGQTITLEIPLTDTQFGTPHININPNLPWSWQIDLSFGRATGNTAPLTFGFDNLRAVPEPVGALALVGFAGLGLLRRRER
jgi:MYXO-CTERM domain-containing protein